MQNAGGGYREEYMKNHNEFNNGVMKYKGNSGITIVALIVTIIIMFILTSVVIRELGTNEKVFFSKSKKAYQQYITESKEQEEKSKALGNVIENAKKEKRPTTKTAPVVNAKVTEAKVILKQIYDRRSQVKVEYRMSEKSGEGKYRQTNIFKDLKPDTVYYVQTKVIEENGNIVESEITTVRTKKENTVYVIEEPECTAKRDSIIVNIDKYKEDKEVSKVYIQVGKEFEENWIESDRVEGLKPDTLYKVQVKVLLKNGDEYYSPVKEVKTLADDELDKNSSKYKVGTEKPSGVASITSIKLENKQTYDTDYVKTVEYAVYKKGEKPIWKSEKEFNGLDDDTNYLAKTRVVRKDKTVVESEELEIKTKKRPKEEASKTAPSAKASVDTITVECKQSYDKRYFKKIMYRITDANGKSGTFVDNNVLSNANSKEVYVQTKIVETDGEVLSDVIKVKMIAREAGNQAPSLAATSSTIVAKNNQTYDTRFDVEISYRIKEEGKSYGKWQTSNQFLGLDDYKNYYVQSMIKYETGEVKESLESSVKTKIDYNKTSKDKPEGKSDFEAITVINKQKYNPRTFERVEYRRVGSGGWTTNNKFTGLTISTKYSFQTRIIHKDGSIKESEVAEIGTIITEAKIGSVYYEKLQQAFDAVPANNVRTKVELLRNVNARNYNILANKNVDFDIKGHEVKVDDNFVNSGKLDIDSEGTIISELGGEFMFINRGELNLKKSNLKSKIKTTMLNESKVNISGTAEVYVDAGDKGIFNKGVLDISGGSVKSKEKMSILNDTNAKVNIKGGGVYSENGICFVNATNGNIVMDGGKIETTGFNGIVNDGTVVLNAGNIKTLKDNCVWNRATGVANLNGSELYSENAEAVINDGKFYLKNSKLSGGQRAGRSSYINRDGGMTEISGGTILGGEGLALYNSLKGNLVLLGGSVESIQGDAFLNEGTAAIKGGVLKSTKKTAVVNKENAKFDISGGQVIGAENTIVNYNTLNVLEGAEVINNGELSMSVIVNDRGHLNISGGNIKSSNSIGIWNAENSYIKLTGGNINVIKNNCIANEGTVEFVNIEIKSMDNIGFWNRSHGTTKFTGGKVSSNTAGALVNDGKVEVSGNVEFISEAPLRSFVGVENRGTSTFKMTDGRIKTNGAFGMINRGKSVVNIERTNISSELQPGIMNEDQSECNILNASIRSGTANAVANDGKMEIVKTTIRANGDNCIWNRSNGTCVVKASDLLTTDNNVITNDGNIKVVENTTIVGETRKEAPTVVNRKNGVMHIQDAKIKANVSNGIFNVDSGKAVLERVDLNSKIGEAVANDAEMEVRDCKMYTEDGVTLWNIDNGRMKLIGGTIKSNTKDGMTNAGRIHISGRPHVSGANDDHKSAVLNRDSGYMEIESLDVSEKMAMGVSNTKKGVCVILDAKIVNENGVAVLNEENSTMTIKGGYFSSKNNIACLNEGILKGDGNYTIQAGPNNKYSAFTNANGGYFEMLAGNINSTKESGLHNDPKSKIKIVNGRIKSETGYGIDNRGTATVSRSVYLSGPKGEIYGGSRS